MSTGRFSIVRATPLLIVALAAMLLIFARSDSAAATSYNPVTNVSVSDPNPGAHADIMINFSLEAPDAFPNLTREPSIQFLPEAWGINAGTADSPPTGAIGGTFNVLTNLGIIASAPCNFPLPIPFTMYDASVDTTKRTGALDAGGDFHPGGPGYSGQFMADPETAGQPPSDFGTALVPFVTLGNNQVGNEFHNGVGAFAPAAAYWQAIYRDNDGSGSTDVPGSGVTVGDTRLTQLHVLGGEALYYPAGSVVAAGDYELGGVQEGERAFIPMAANEKHTESVAANGLMDVGEGVYTDADNSGDVSYHDVRQFKFEGVSPETIVVPKTFLPGGVSRYPDFLAEMFPPEVVGEPLARMWGGRMVLNQTAVSVNLVTFRPGQLEAYGFSASLGYATATIVLDPVAPPEMFQNNAVNVTCTPMALTSTNFGVSHDNPDTPLVDESGYVRLTNPGPRQNGWQGEKDYTFTLVTTSDYDADDDGIENWLDTCDLTPDLPLGTDGRGLFGGPGDNEPGIWGEPGDGLNEACDPDPLRTTINEWWLVGDEDLDGYANVADNCPLNGNGFDSFDLAFQRGPSPFNFIWAVPGGPVGPNNQVDTDGDRIGDVCEGSESGPQCANDLDDDADGAVNDGCPTNPVRYEESGAQCDNATDDDADGKVNDGCPMVQSGGVAESGAQCDNATDDDADGLINDGCPNAIGSAETGAQCANATDDDADGLINDGCPVNGAAESGFRCNDALDNEPSWQGGPDGYVNDGCPRNGANPESGAQCLNAVDDDGDGKVNDGCPVNESAISSLCLNATDDDGDGKVNDGCPKDPVKWGESGAQCNNATDDDGDGKINDGCPKAETPGAPETGDQCNNAVDDDSDGLVNDGCPAVDPGDYAKTHTTGHKHVVTLTQGVPIGKHGVKLDKPSKDGSASVASGGSFVLTTAVESKSSTSEVAPVGVRVLPGGCAKVNGVASQNSAMLSLNPDQTKTVNFTVDWSGCPDGYYTVQADTCHGNDPAPAGLFGVGACSGVGDGKVDTNPLDDAVRSRTVKVGSP